MRVALLIAYKPTGTVTSHSILPFLISCPESRVKSGARNYFSDGVRLSWYSPRPLFRQRQGTRGRRGEDTTRWTIILPK